MASLVGSEGWKPMVRNSSWALPAGAAAGDVVVAVAVANSQTAVPPGFTVAATRAFGIQPGWGWLVRQPYLIISTRTVTAGLSSVKWDAAGPRLGDMAIIVVRETLGVGVSRADAQVPVRDGGAAIMLAGGYTAPSVPSGPSWSTPHEVPTQVASRKFHTRWGWQELPGGGVVGGSVSGGWGLAIELLPPAGPMPPLLTAPEDGAEVTVTAQTPLALSWRHRTSRTGGSQDAFQLQRIASGVGRQWWSVAAQAWESGPVTNPGGAQSATIPVAATIQDQVVGWTVRTRETLGGAWSDWAPEHTFMRVTPPSVTVTGPAVTVTDDLSPDVTWTPTTPRGSQTAWRVRVVHAVTGVQVWDSGVVAGGASVVTIPASTEWVRGQRYRAVVSVQQTGGSWSPDSSREFVMTWTQPPLPTVALDTDGPGVGVAVSADAALVVEVQRSTDGAQFVPLATWTGGGKIRDVFAAYGLPTQYRARTGTVLEGQRLWSDWVTSNPVTSLDDEGYIASAVDPATTWQRLHLTADRQRIDQEPIAVAYGLGDSRPRVSHGPARGQAGEFSVWSEHGAGTDALRGLLGVREPLLLRLPPDRDCLVDLPEVLTVARSAQVGRDRLIQASTHRGRIVTFAWVEQEPPALGASMAPVINPVERI